jgi:predicted transposase/invertase (TIGR01784 family)
MGDRNLIRFDWAMKRLLRNKADYTVLEGFLSELLKDDITIQYILESESNQQMESDKFNRVDILVKNAKDELVIVEIQNQNEYDYFHRMA